MSVYREADSSAPLAITPAIDFAIVLSRTLADLNKDPAQLRNVVYQLARIKLEQEVAQRNSRVTRRNGTVVISTRVRDRSCRNHILEVRQSEIAILQSEQSGRRPPENSDQPPKASARDSYFLTAFLRWIPWIGISRVNARSWQWQPGRPLLRAAIVMTVAFALFSCSIVISLFSGVSPQRRSQLRFKTTKCRRLSNWRRFSRQPLRILTICGICAAHRLWRLRRERWSITRAGTLGWQSA